MNTFDYVRPATVQAAVVATSEPGAAYLAAGTNLLDLMKGGVTRPGRLVDITHLPDLDRIDELPDGGVRIGALVRNALDAFRRSPRRFCPERLRSFATPPSWAAISGSARAAPISTT
jgi:xanthine dehydrogenase YagS FAD-binding subunit